MLLFINVRADWRGLRCFSWKRGCRHSRSRSAERTLINSAQTHLTFNFSTDLCQACRVNTQDHSFLFFPETQIPSLLSFLFLFFSLLSFFFCPHPLPSLRIAPGGKSWRDGWRELGMLLWIKILIKQVWWGKVGFILAALGTKTYSGQRALQHKQLATASRCMIARGSRPSD